MNQLFRSMQHFSLAFFLSLFAAAAMSAIPQTINYQGRLTDNTNQPLGVPMPVLLPMTFKLYTASIGGMPIFTEAQSVTVSNGVFNVQIGSTTALALPFDVPYFLEIVINMEVLTPRQPLASAAYAMRTEYASRSGCTPGDRIGCYSFASGAPGVGPCQAGVRVCNAQGTAFGSCVGEVGPNCGSVCANLLTDNQNCGACGIVCTGGQTCGGGGMPGACGGQAANVCGDGVIGGTEQCDGVNLGGQSCVGLGYSGGSLSCNQMCQFNVAACTAAPACGDGIVQAGETCDDHNATNGDGCSAMCQVEPGYSCVGSPSVCSPVMPVCGDGIVGAGESCDDGNLINGDGCSAACQIEPGNFCSGSPSVCTALKANGTVCSSNNQCQTSICADGVCSNSVCNGICLATNLAGSLGICTPIPSGQPDNNPICSGNQACNGAGACLNKTGSSCTTNGQCLSSNCAMGFCS